MAFQVRRQLSPDVLHTDADAEKQTGHNQRSDMRMDEILNKKEAMYSEIPPGWEKSWRA